MIDISSNKEFNYLFSRMYYSKPVLKELYQGSFFVAIFEISDSKITPDGLFEGSDETLTSYLVSLKPDGDFYTWSKLYKFRRLYKSCSC